MAQKWNQHHIDKDTNLPKTCNMYINNVYMYINI